MSSSATRVPRQGSWPAGCNAGRESARPTLNEAHHRLSPGEEDEMHPAWSRFAVIAGLALAAAPGLAGADGWRGSGSSNLRTPYGAYVLLGGGVTDFTEDAVKDRFDAGGSWDLRLGLGSRFYLGGEVAYVGSIRSSADGSGSDLLSNGGEAVLRVQYPYATGSWLVEPFVFGGIGWNRVSLEDAPPGLEDSDDVGVVPFGAGVTLGNGRLLLDARFTYRTSFDEDLALAVGEGPANLEQWGVTAAIGYEF
jgi:hypothetical protein